MPNPTPHARPKSWGRERVALPEHNVQSDSTYLMGFPSPYSISAFPTRAVAPWPGGPPPTPPRQRACTSTFVELHAPAHSQTTTHKQKQVEPSPLPPAPSCADNPFSAADSVYSLYEDSKAFLDASLDITGMLASPAPARAAGDRQSPHQAEQKQAVDKSLQSYLTQDQQQFRPSPIHQHPILNYKMTNVFSQASQSFQAQEQQQVPWW